jgi:hypothetical protein
MVIDANGQISISYVDANGKTIATALAGNPPSNVQPLPSYYPETMLNKNLLDTNGYHPTNTSILSSYGLIATNSGDYHFAYKLFPTDYLSGCSNSYCADCIYDIELLITPACGGSPPVIIHYDTNFTYREAFDTTCSRDSNIIDTFTIYLESGEYNVMRLVTVDEGAINFYTQRFLSHNTCLANYKSFLDTAIANTDFSGCGITCQTCLASLGTESAFLHKFITQLINAHDTVHHQDTVNGELMYDSAVVHCNQLCAPSNICAGLYQEMLADVSPGGQYFLYDTTGGNYKPADSTSVLRVSIYQSPTTPYLDANGNRDSVMINNLNLPPQQLNQTDFVKNWQSTWAASIVTNHPEYCYYKYCEMDTASNRYDADMLNTTTFSAALAAGFLNPVGDSSEPVIGSPYTINWDDPYFRGVTSPLGYTMLRPMINNLENYVTITVSHSPVTLSLWQASALAVNCMTDTLSNINITYAPPAFGTGCAGDLNMQWEFFRGVYISLKQHIQDSLENVYVSSSGCNIYAECIGQNIAPCASTSYDTKAPRHVTPNEIESNTHVMTNWTSSTAATHAFDSALTASCDTQCKSYAYAWLEELSGCGTLTTAQSDSLIAGFEEVCEVGCNANHPIGSSTTPDYEVDSRGDRDFEDVIIRVLGTARANLKCDSLDINMPPPYIDSTGITGPPVTYYKLPACVCNNLDTLLTYYYKPDSLSGDTSYKNFADYLNKKFGGNLADSTVYQLMALCNNSSCFFLQHPIQLPIWMTCCSNPQVYRTFDAYDTVAHVLTLKWDTTVAITQGCCIKCSDIDAGMRIFEEEMPPMADTLSNYQTLLANFLNNLYSFNLTYSQYMAFYGECSSIHCTVSYTTTSVYIDRCGIEAIVYDSMCGNYTIIDTIPGYNCHGTSRTVIGVLKTDSLAPYLCNEPMNTVPPTMDSNNCVSQLMQDAEYNAENAYTQYVDSVISAFTAGYIAHCMQVDDSFHVKAPFDEYHYTLYYYDQAENLVKTVPPQGVHPITLSASLDSITQYRKGTPGYSPVYPNFDSLASLYWFNSLNSPVQQATPDGNITHYWYDRLGRLVLSQNAVQEPYLYSYTEYDPLNRITEVGQLSTQVEEKTITVYPVWAASVDSGLMGPINNNRLYRIARNDDSLNFWLSHTPHTQVTHTYYDTVAFPNIPLQQQNLRKRISTITYQEIGFDTIVHDTVHVIYYMHTPTVESYIIWYVPEDVAR